MWDKRLSEYFSLSLCLACRFPERKAICISSNNHCPKNVVSAHNANQTCCFSVAVVTIKFSNVAHAIDIWDLFCFIDFDFELNHSDNCTSFLIIHGFWDVLFFELHFASLVGSQIHPGPRRYIREEAHKAQTPPPCRRLVILPFQSWMFLGATTMIFCVQTM